MTVSEEREATAPSRTLEVALRTITVPGSKSGVEISDSSAQSESTRFSERGVFYSATFSEEAYFNSAEFSGEANYNSPEFSYQYGAAFFFW